MEWYLIVLKKYAEFDGRARRQEYWMFQLFNFLAVLAMTVLGMLGILINQDYGFILVIPGFLYCLAVFIPSIAVAVRRFHDTGRSGSMLLLLMVLGVIPLVGFIASIVKLVFMCEDSAPGTNQYGRNPKYPGQFATAFAGISPYQSPGLHVQSPSVPLAGMPSLPTYCRACGATLNEASHFCATCGAHR